MLVTINEKRFSLLQVVELHSQPETIDTLNDTIDQEERFWVQLVVGCIDLTADEYAAVVRLWDQHAEKLTPCAEGDLPTPDSPTGRDFGDDWASQDQNQDGVSGGEGVDTTQ